MDAQGNIHQIDALLTDEEARALEPLPPAGRHGALMRMRLDAQMRDLEAELLAMRRRWT